MQKFCSLPLEGGGFGGLRRSRKEFKVNELLTPSVGFADSVSLRLGHATALTVRRTVIHYRVDASLPGGGTHALRKLLLTS